MLRSFPPIIICFALTLTGAFIARPAVSCPPTFTGDFTEGPPMIIGDTGLGTYSVSGSDCSISVDGSVNVGRTDSGIGSFNVSDSATFTSSHLFVGGMGLGNATFQSGAHIITTTGGLTLGAGDLTEPSAANARGDVVVSGEGTLVEVETGVTVGLRESALLTVSGGAEIQAQQGLNISGLSGTPGGDGEVIITGAGSTIQTALGYESSSRVGYNGPGSLTVDQGGTLETYDFAVAPGGSGTVLVDNGGHIQANIVSVGSSDLGTGSLTIQGGATVAAAKLGLDSGAGHNVEMTISGANSEFTATDIVTNLLGHTGGATLRIEDGAAARFDGDLYLGQSARYSPGGTIEVVGAGSELVARGIQLSHSDSGASGRGVLELEGGTVTATTVRILGLTNDYRGELRGSGLLVGNLRVEKGELIVGSPIGKLEVDGYFLMQWRTYLEIAGPQVGEYDQLDVSGDVNLTGVVHLDFIDGYEPQSGDFFDIILAGGTLNYDPSSTSITGLTLPPEAELVTTIMSDRVRIQVVPEPATLLSQAASLLVLLALRRLRQSTAPDA